MTDIVTDQKWCKGCGEPKLLSDFYAEPKNRDGRQGKCKECMKAYDRRRYEKHREAIIAQGVARKNRWKQENYEKHRAYQRGLEKARRAAPGSHTIAEIAELYFGQAGMCAYCQFPLEDNYHADHMMPLSRGGSDYISNIALSCPRCNISKGNKTVQEFIEHLTRFNQPVILASDRSCAL